MQSINRSGAKLRLADTSHPAASVTGGAWVMGLRAIGVVSATQSCSLRIEVDSPLGNLSVHQPAVGQSNFQRSAGPRQILAQQGHAD